MSAAKCSLLRPCGSRVSCMQTFRVQNDVLRPSSSRVFQINQSSLIRSRRNDRNRLQVTSGVVGPGDCVLVVGATGGVGQVLTGKLLERKFKVKALSRDTTKAQKYFGNAEGLELVEGDCRNADFVKGLFDGVDAVICILGTTAFPSARWKGDNGPEQTDSIATGNLIRATPKSIKRFVYNTSAGVERYNKLPFSILNLFGVLKYKRQSEQLLEQSGIPWTIFRPGRLTDGPYTSYDINTLLQATSGNRQDVQLTAKDELNGQASRVVLAEALLQSLQSSEAENKKFALSSTEGNGPGSDKQKWQTLFNSV